MNNKEMYQHRKTPEPDGFTNKFCQTFEEKVFIATLLKLFQNI